METSFRNFDPKLHEIIEKGSNKRLFLNKKTNQIDHVETIIIGEMATQQHYADDCDINKIMKKHKKDRSIIIQGAKKGLYADLIDAPDYKESINLIREANEAFHTLPSGERARFENNPEKFLEYLSDQKNTEDHYQKGYRVRKTNDDDKTTTKKNEPVTKTDTKNEST